jgi:smad nuclear-interacting protein 1
MSAPNHNNQRKRSRWGRPGDSLSSSASRPAAPAVSDQDALKALLQSAAARARELEPAKRQRRDDRRQPIGNTSANKSSSNNSNRNKVVADDDYYARPNDRGGTLPANDSDDVAIAPPSQKPNFGLSGALAKDDTKGNTYKGVLLKFSEPPEARAPNTQWRFYVFKGDEQTETLHVSKQSAYLFGRNTDVCDIVLLHGSCSSQHAVMQYRALPNKETGRLQCQPYIMDLESTNGTFINGVQLDAARYYQLKKGDVLKFGASTREYVLLSANTKSIDLK